MCVKRDILLLFAKQLKTKQQLRGNKYYTIIESIDVENFGLPCFQIVNYCNYCRNLGIPFSSQLLLFHNWPWKSWFLRFNISTYWISSIDIFSIEYENFDSSSYTIHSILLRSTTKVFVPFFLISFFWFFDSFFWFLFWFLCRISKLWSLLFQDTSLLLVLFPRELKLNKGLPVDSSTYLHRKSMEKLCSGPCR